MILEYKGMQVSIYADELGDLTARIGGPLQLEVVSGWGASDEDAHLKLTRACRAIIDSHFREVLLAAAKHFESAPSDSGAGQVLAFPAKMRA